MNTLLLLVILSISNTYKLDDFYYGGKDKLPHALPLANKILIDLTKVKKAEVIDYFKDEDIKEVSNELWKSALVVEFQDKVKTLEVFNKMVAEFKGIYLIVTYDKIQVVLDNEVLIHLKEGVTTGEYLSRIKSVSEGKYTIEDLGDGLCSLKVSALKNPTNILKLANFINSDTFWVENARVGFLPFDYYINLQASVETKSNTHLGERRLVRLQIDVYTPDIKIRKDLLPKLGNPIAFAGDAWFETEQPIVREKDHGMGRKSITVDYPFIYVYYGDFFFSPMTISFENKGKLETLRTTNISFVIKSITLDTNIDDIIQPNNDWQLGQLSIVKPIDPNQLLRKIINYTKFLSTGFLILLGLIFTVPLAVSFTSSIIDRFNQTKAMASWKLWNDLRLCIYMGYVPATWRDDYTHVIEKLNDIMVDEFGVSLHSIIAHECNASFREMICELDNLYKPHGFVLITPVAVIKGIKSFCKSRKYD